MSPLSRVRNILSVLLVCVLALPASAQMDPRLQKGNTDLLDVYRTNPANPELLTVYDFSGSMHAVYWDKRYYTNPAQNNHGDQWLVPSQNNDGGEFPGIVPVLDSNGKVYLVAGTGYRNDVRTTGYYDRIILPAGVKNDGSGQLIAPDGSVVAVGSGSNPLLDAVQKASHVRMTATNGTVTRTVDLPIPWVVLDSTLSSSNASATKVVITDPKGGPAMPPDTVCDPLTASNRSTAEGNLINDRIDDASLVRGGTGKSFYKIGRFHYTRDYLWWIFFGQTVRNGTNDGEVSNGGYVIPESSAASAWKNGLPGMTRYQALKYATVVAWFANQDKVWWGIRFLDDAENGKTTTSANNGNASTPQTDRNINLLRSAQNGNVNSMLSAFVGFIPSTSTPLTFAMANAYMQMAYTKDSGSTFGTSSGGGQSGTENPIPPCRKSFVVVFTDGIANDEKYGGGSAIGTGDPYHQTSGGAPTNNRQAGNNAIGGYGGLAALRPGNNLFNIWTLAGVAAQYDTPTLPWIGPGGTTAYAVDKYAPWRVTSRGATPAAPRKIRTMTVGMSLAGSTKDTASGKADLFRAALYGNPDAKSWDLNTPPFDATKTGQDDPAVNPFFFDAYSVEALSAAMTAVLAEVTSGSASIAAPASPLVGLSLGSQVYLGLFQTAKGPRWPGDLLMAGLYVGPSGVVFVDKNANAVQNITDENAVWSSNLHVFGDTEGRNWTNRNLYTNYVPATNSANTTSLVKFDEATITNPASVGAGTDDAIRKAYIRFMRGANSSDETPATATFTGNRPDIMGDIIDSSPGVLEYPISALTATVSTKLAGKLGNVPSGSTPRFRVIFVGDNQGVFHAFGELSWTTPGKIKFTTVVTDPVTGDVSTVEKTVDGEIPHGEVDEIWSFIPGEYLRYISYLRGKTNFHRYMVNGSPTIYFKDVPASGQVRGNGMVDGTDVVRVIIGLKKGGRSYYSFDFSDLEKAVLNTGSILSWKLVPDDFANSATGQQNVLRHMGFSTTTPALSRVDIGPNLNQDMVFLGGGLSTAEVDAAFAADSSFNDSNAKLGRSVVAFDVVSGPGTSLYTWDFRDAAFTSTFGAMGCVPAGVQPLEFFPGSGHTQRVYFADAPTLPNVSATRGSGVWALGSTNLAANGVIRLDSSDINTWTGGSTASTTQGVRHIFQADKGFSVTTTPTPFLLANPYPAIRTADPKAAPVAVGLAFGTGDRNDPMDNDLINPATVSTSTGKITGTYNNWLNVVFDRQDSRALSGLTGVLTSNADLVGLQQGSTSTAGDLADLTTVSSFTGTFNGFSVDPANSAYYLKSKPGYKLKVGSPAVKDSSLPTYYFPKVITNTAVLNGVLFFSGFVPAAGTDSCQGTGITNTYRICNVLQPTFNSGSTQAVPTSFNGGDPTCSGIVLTYPNLPGEITALGTAAIVQSGQGSVDGQPGTISNAGAQVGGSFGKTSGFGFKPRSWRIIR